MSNEKIDKPKQIISFSNLPSIIVVVIFIVGIGAVFGLLGYLVSGIKENVTPVAQKPSVKITDEYFGNDFIQVKSPQKNAVVKNPVLILGKANVDEANVRVKITDDNKNILADTFITADGWMDKLYPFEKEISYETPQTENGLIEIFEESARDGSEIYKVKIPVVFEDYEDAFSDWKVYRNEEFGFEMKYPEEYIIKIKQELKELKNEYIVKNKQEIEFDKIKLLVEFYIDNQEDAPFPNMFIVVGGKDNNKLSLKDFLKNTYKSEDLQFVESENPNRIKAVRVTGPRNKYGLMLKPSTLCTSWCFGNEKYIFNVRYWQNWIRSDSSDSYYDLNAKHHVQLGNDIFSTFKFIEKEEIADRNKPSIYSSKGGGSLLLLNGEKTEFPVHEFKEQEFILFTDRKFGDYGAKDRSLKTISTKYPFEEKNLSNEIGYLIFSDFDLFEEAGLYFGGKFSDGPGSGISVFMFKPESKEFIYFVREAMLDVDIKIASSKSSTIFNAEKKARRLLGENKDSLSDSDIEIIINDEKLSKKDVDNGHLIENQEAIFNCRPPGFIVSNDYYNHPDRYFDSYGDMVDRGKINIRRYVEYFPDKFPCFVNEESDEITGYFDLVENEFVPASDLEQ